MKAIITTRYGSPDVLQLRDVAKPALANDAVLIKLSASSVNPLDSFIIRGPLFFLPALTHLLQPKHRIAGADISGTIESVGEDVLTLRPGDEVFGGSFGKTGLGGFSEYVSARPEHLIKKPANVSFEEAAAVPVAAITALQGLRDHGHLQPGQSVLIEGASGGVGTFAIQIAKYLQAEVTAICSTRNAAIARCLGADQVIDYSQQDFTKHSTRYDLVLGVNAHHSLFDYRRVLKPSGAFVMIGGGWTNLLQGFLLSPLLSRIGSNKFCFFIAKINTADLLLLKDLLASKTIVPVIDQIYPLSQVADAIRYREEGHAQGKIVITIGEHPSRPKSEPRSDDRLVL